MSLNITKTFKFRSGISKGNYAEGVPMYLKQLFEAEYSPVKTYLETINPNCDVTISIDLEISQ